MFVTINGRRVLPRIVALLAIFVLTLLLSRIAPDARTASGGLTAISRADIAEKRIALTFDVTWGTKNVPLILQTLKDQGVHATFFVTAHWVETHPDVLKQIHAAGHEIGTLGTLQADLTQLPAVKVHESLVAAQAGLNRVLGQPARYFRPLMGRLNDDVLLAAQQADLITITASVTSPDLVSSDTPATKITSRVLEMVRPGDIVQLTASDFVPGTPQALGPTLKTLKERGYQVATVGGLIPLAPNATEPMTPPPAKP